MTEMSISRGKETRHGVEGKLCMNQIFSKKNQNWII